MRKIIYIYIFLTLSSSNFVWASCSQNEAMQAESSASLLKSWNEIYDSFIKYAHCDDGAIGEGYSESISQILANHWDQLKILEKLIQKNKNFGTFVLKHIDQSIAEDTRLKILNNALKRCPSKSKVLCKKITSSAKSR